MNKRRPDDSHLHDDVTEQDAVQQLGEVQVRGPVVWHERPHLRIRERVCVCVRQLSRVRAREGSRCSSLQTELTQVTSGLSMKSSRAGRKTPLSIVPAASL